MNKQLSPSEELRSDAEFTSRMLELLSDPIMQRALAVLKAEGEEDVAEGSDALASVRALARQSSRSKTISALVLLSVPLEVEELTPLPSFGTNLTPQELAEAYAPET